MDEQYPGYPGLGQSGPQPYIYSQMMANRTPVRQPMQVMPQQPVNQNMQSQVYEPELFIVPVQSRAAVDNHMFAKGRTGVYINFGAKTFWVKRQNDDGLSYTTREYRFNEVEDPNQMSFDQIQNANSVTKEEFNALQESVLSIKKTLEEFMK